MIEVFQRRLGAVRLLAGLLAMGVCGSALSARRTCPEKLGEAPPFRVALWTSGACDRNCVDHSFKHFSSFPELIQIDFLLSRDFRTRKLEQYDALVVPGGYMAQYLPAVGEEGAASIREFVENGGIYLGICAGAYTCSEGFYTPFFTPEGVVSLDSVGRGHATLEMTPDGKKLWGEKSSAPVVRYLNGPSIELSTKANHATVLARFVAFEPTEPPVAEGQPFGPEIGSIAALKCGYGLGTCLLFSPHPELSPGFEWLLSDALIHELKATPLRTFRLEQRPYAWF